jgi:TetR/AcrR family transcriptional repressor of nem operon
MNESIPTDQRILDSAQQLLQARGYNGFSYKDIAADVNIKTSSIHYHFATKQILIGCLFERYSTNFFDLLEQIAQSDKSRLACLEALCEIFEDTARSGRFCMCGSLAAVYYAVPENVNIQIQQFTQKAKRWIEQVLEQGIQSGEVSIRTTSKEHATILFAALEGALLLSQSGATGIDDLKTTVTGLLATTAA